MANDERSDHFILVFSNGQGLDQQVLAFAVLQSAEQAGNKIIVGKSLDRRWRDVAAAAPYDFVIMLVNVRELQADKVFLTRQAPVAILAGVVLRDQRAQQFVALVRRRPTRKQLVPVE